jgi:polar amino acid transport system permease protein
MTEQLHFSELWPHWPELLAELWVTIQLTVLATIGGLAIGISAPPIAAGARRGSAGFGAVCGTDPQHAVCGAAVFYRLRLTESGAEDDGGRSGAAGDGGEPGAYSTEIVRAGIQVTPKGQWEAGRVLGLTRTQTFIQ